MSLKLNFFISKRGILFPTAEIVVELERDHAYESILETA